MRRRLYQDQCFCRPVRNAHTSEVDSRTMCGTSLCASNLSMSLGPTHNMHSGLLGLPFPRQERSCTTQSSVQETETTLAILSRRGFNTGKLLLTE